MITLFHYEQLFKFGSFLFYPMEVIRLKCAMLGAFIVNHFGLVLDVTIFKMAHKSNLAFLVQIREIERFIAKFNP